MNNHHLSRPAILLSFLALLLTPVSRPAAARDEEYIRALERAQQQRPATLAAVARIAPENEPGTPLAIHGRLLGEDGRSPVAGAVVFAYHTDREGHYDRPGSPAHSWRLRGWARTDADGRFEFRTIRPAPYPGRDTPAHVHFAFFTSGGRYFGELRFADDPLVTAAELAASRRAGAFGEVRPVRREAGIQHVELSLRLERRNRL